MDFTVLRCGFQPALNNSYSSARKAKNRDAIGLHHLILKEEFNSFNKRMSLTGSWSSVDVNAVIGARTNDLGLALVVAVSYHFKYMRLWSWLFCAMRKVSQEIFFARAGIFDDPQFWRSGLLSWLFRKAVPIEFRQEIDFVAKNWFRLFSWSTGRIFFVTGFRENRFFVRNCFF